MAPGSSMRPRLAWVLSREARVISRFPFRPSRAGTRMNTSVTSVNTRQCCRNTQREGGVVRCQQIHARGRGGGQKHARGRGQKHARGRGQKHARGGVKNTHGDGEGVGNTHREGEGWSDGPQIHAHRICGSNSARDVNKCQMQGSGKSRSTDICHE